MFQSYILCFYLLLLVFLTNCKQYGYLDLFTCHCQTDDVCQTSGECPNVGCSTRWFGPTCQKQNVAFGKSAKQSSKNGRRGPELVVDGNRGKGAEICMDTDYSNNRWWSVNLLDDYPIRQIHIIYRDSLYLYTLEGFKINVIKDDGSEIECYKQIGTVTSTDFTVECNDVIWGNGINISSTSGGSGSSQHFFAFCEVEVYVCSVRTYGEQCEKFCYCKDNVRCNYQTGECPTGCLPGWTGKSCNQDCPDGQYGKKCSKMCHERNCSQSTDCDKIYGRCIGGCKPGFISIDCTQVCDIGKYGFNCSKDCNDRHCNELQDCSVETGECLDGCLPGYTGPDCTQNCPDGQYGKHCSKLCNARDCSQSTDCDKIYGRCIDGCKPGFISNDCTQDDVDKNTSVIIGSVLGVIVLVLVIIIILVVVYFRKRLAKASEHHHVVDTNVLSSTSHEEESQNNILSSFSGSQKAANTAATNDDYDYVNKEVEDETIEESSPNNYAQLGAAYQNENMYEKFNN